MDTASRQVSVIVPVYNTEKYLRRCLESLVHQTLKDLEILMVDDGSTDHSPEILSEFENNYPGRVRVIRKENGGQASARNLGIRECIGNYVGFVDSDDYVDAAMYEEMLRAALADNCDMVECSYHYIQEKDGQQKELATRGNIRQYRDRKDMFIDPMTCPWNKLIRREILLREGMEFPEGRIYEDTAFCIKLIPYLQRETYVDRPFVSYILRETSTMNANKSKKVADIFPVLQNILDFYRERGFYEEYRQELEYFCVKILLCSSLSRIGRVPDARLRKDLLDQTFAFLQEHFPDYRTNPYVRGKIGIYLRNVRRWNCQPVAVLSGRILKG